LRAEFFDVGAQCVQTGVHFGGPAFRVHFHLLRFGNALLNFLGPRGKQRRQMLGHQISQTRRQDREIRPLPDRRWLRGLPSRFTRLVFGRLLRQQSGRREDRDQQKPLHAVLPSTIATI
jgi:hypothetical protein